MEPASSLGQSSRHFRRHRGRRIGAKALDAEMKLVDANLLLYAVNADAPLHEGARTWMEDTLSGSETVAFAWIVMLAFVRIATRAGIFPKPLSPEDAFTHLQQWLSAPAATVVHPGPKHFDIFRRLITPLGTGGNVTSDGHLAALAIEHGGVLYSCDSDFSRFPGLSWRNPLDPSER